MKKIVFFALLALCPLVVYFLNFHGGISSEHTRWAEFGSYASGVYGALAFIGLVYTLHTTRENFISQSQDTTFFKIWDSLQLRIANEVVRVADKEYSGQSAISFIVNEMLNELNEESILIGRNLLCESPESITSPHDARIFDAIKNGKLPYLTIPCDSNSLMNEIRTLDDFSSRWEKLKCYIGSNWEEHEELTNALGALGSVNFYKIPFNKRKDHYQRAMSRIKNNYGHAVDGLFKNTIYLIDYACDSMNPNFYMDFIKNQLSRYDLVLLFYCVASADESSLYSKKMVQAGILEGILDFDCQQLMIDMPPIDVLRNEIAYIQGVN